MKALIRREGKWLVRHATVEVLGHSLESPLDLNPSPIKSRRTFSPQTSQNHCEVNAAHFTPRRWLNLQEYQSKKLMADNGVKVQRFFVVDTAKEALEAAKKLSKLTLPVECVAPSSERTGSGFPPVTSLCCGLYSVTDLVGTLSCKGKRALCTGHAQPAGHTSQALLCFFKGDCTGQTV
ncbi:Succinyl-CoA ligase [GDP-forming] subunit beta, mitochondrial [Myotis brandtii]|uniref:Succinyl-CoA ligase [GDP-forming] subunit beta, mitochondrial n=1 Tax=Myotis brandtii TaxID=109478 RepID=S7MJM0_MYOBR|nr:Succinyl-CoA ligase [GDP-forming] subunit beta, mitochondrial [Myotis brandtii]